LAGCKLPDLRTLKNVVVIVGPVESEEKVGIRWFTLIRGFRALGKTCGESPPVSTTVEAGGFLSPLPMDLSTIERVVFHNKKWLFHSLYRQKIYLSLPTGLYSHN
jgi:hypothetical protein